MHMGHRGKLPTARPMRYQETKQSEGEMCRTGNNSLPPKHLLQDRRHGGGVGDDYGTDYGLAPPNHKTTQPVVKNVKARSKGDRRSGRSKSKLADSRSCPGETKHPETTTKELLNDILPPEALTSTLRRDEEELNDLWTIEGEGNSSDDNDSDTTEVLRPTTPSFMNNAVLRYTQNSKPQNNPRSNLSIDDFSQNLNSSPVLLYKRRQNQGMGVCSATGSKDTPGIFQADNRSYKRPELGFNVHQRTPQMQGNIGSQVKNINQRSRSLHGLSNRPGEQMQKQNGAVLSQENGDYYNRFARQPRRADVCVKLPPISAPPDIAINKKQRRTRPKKVLGS